ncbi:hypothetical protein R83H12_00241 [Fibrobacteria bacterium R8-3-H12]
MTFQDQQHTKQEGYNLAVRYIANAKDTLKKAGRDGIYFEDAKYVSSASGIAYKGVLTALDTWLQLKGVELPRKESGRAKGKSIDFYRTNLTKLDKKLLRALNVAYDNLHLAGYYDGTLSFGTISDGFKSALEIIETIKPGAGSKNLTKEVL